MKSNAVLLGVVFAIDCPRICRRRFSTNKRCVLARGATGIAHPYRARERTVCGELHSQRYRRDAATQKRQEILTQTTPPRGWGHKGKPRAGCDGACRDGFGEEGPGSDPLADRPLNAVEAPSQ